MGVNFLSFNLTKLFTASQIKIFSLLLLKGSSKFSKIFVTVTFKAKRLWDNLSQRILCLYNNRAVERSLYNSNAAVESCHPPSISMTKISTNQKNNMRLNWYKLDTHKLIVSILFSNNKLIAKVKNVHLRGYQSKLDSIWIINPRISVFPSIVICFFKLNLFLVNGFFTLVSWWERA